MQEQQSAVEEASSTDTQPGPLLAITFCTGFVFRFCGSVFLPFEADPLALFLVHPPVSNLMKYY